MNNTPKMPPKSARAPIFQILGLKPQRKSAGMVKMIPEARDELADPVVWAMLHSKIELLPRSGAKTLNMATEITARGMAVDIVKPTLSPR
jgi:hypothetical protein